MRKGIAFIVLIAASYLVFPQEATAADLPSLQTPVRVPNAYEILGLVPGEDEVTLLGSQAGSGQASIAGSQVLVQLNDEVSTSDDLPTVEVPVDAEEGSDAEGSLTPDEQPGVEEEIEAAEEADAGEAAEAEEAEEPLEDPESLAEEELINAGEPDQESEPEAGDEDPAISERSVPGNGTSVESSGLPVEAEALAEPQAEQLEEEIVEAADESIEDALLAEILRLLEERDELNRTIDGLKEENKLLATKAEEAEFYKVLADSLKLRITELEIQLAETELALSESAEALLQAQAGLETYQGRASELESSLAVSEAGLKAAQMEREKLQTQLAEARKEVEGSLGSEKQPDNARVDALKAERDAALEARTQAEAARRAAEAARTAAELSRAATEAVLAEALAKGLVTVAPDKSHREAVNGYLSGWTLDTSRFTKLLRSDLLDSSARMGTWVVQGAGARQTDASQYFSRLELPLAQDGKPLLYSFRARATGRGWVGLGLHFFVEDVVKRRGYGEGKSLLIWFTRDQAARGVDTTYLQLYRSDNDVVMERMFDAALGDSLVVWRKVDIVYDPGAEYVAVSVDGVLRVVYKTFFGRTSGTTVALRTLGGGVEFADFSVRGE